ncbi:zinc finger protein BRUTUS-like At1g18910 isoform X1 [Prunus avium]|uniref:Zinc finger protein BRUTUS-like At1g18910 isoform X1 n=1 Tax=Prunus avium TaxID=42229 RepID=A0A6P5S109_PRUAV|nr:zinc finger protein BRUTUS-like At1g18910 isoform X1 [Prunus avium]
MGGDDNSPQCLLPPSINDTQPASSSPSSGAHVRLVHTPILFLVCFHKALRAELENLRHVTSAALESASRDRQGRDFVLQLLRRFEFLKLAYKYHCSAEDEIIFLALDGRTKNVASTYSLEHRTIDGLFDSIFNRLDALLDENGNISKQFQELVFCIGTLQAFICQHMLKEEEQVFPLILQQFSAEEQASLVWQFMCSIPLVLLEDLLPWMMSFLPPDEQEEVIHCIKEIVPDEKSLQEVVLSWLASNEQVTFEANNKAGGAQHTGESADLKKLLKSHSPKRFFEENRSSIKANCVHSEVGYNPVDGLHLWHAAIMKDLTRILEELYQLRSSSSFLSLDSIVVQLKFFADVLAFYSSALEKLFHPVLNELFNSCLYPSSEQFPNEIHVEGLQRLLYCTPENGTPLCKFVEKLCWELESFVVGINKHFAFQETKVFPIVRMNCSHEMQQQLLYVSLHILPLGLLKCTTTWFSACLSEDESRSILSSLKQGDSLVNKSFASLLHEWFRIGHSGKTSVEKFRKDLQQIFKSRCTSLSKQFYDTTGSSSLSSNVQPCEGSNTRLIAPISSDKGKNSMPYSSGTNIHIYFPGTMKTSHHLPESLSGENLLGYDLHEPKPVDLIFFFHKALKKDLEYLVFGSAQLAENVAFLTDFCRRFHLIQFLYQIHSEAEDEVAFPALEAKGKLQNISHSYTMDHKLEVEHFNKISLILDEMSQLDVSASKVESNTVDQKMLQHHQLCMRLHDMCKSMCYLLTEHIHREEVELWPLFKECFSIKEQEKIVGCILGRTEAKILQDMLPWLMESLTPEEQQAMMSLWRQVTRNTMFDEWLKEWWEGYDAAKVVEESNVPPPSLTADPLEIVCTYLCGSGEQEGSVCYKSINCSDKDSPAVNTKPFENSDVDEKPKDSDSNRCIYTDTEYVRPCAKGDKKRCQEVENATNQINDPVQLFQASQKSKYCECLLTLGQEDLEAAIRKISRDSSLDPQKKSHMIQNLLMSRWIVRQHSELRDTSNGKEFPGQHPSYQDPFGLTFGCKHYKRNCKLVAACCNQLYTCIRCHDEMADHTIDRRSITEMMCMKCLKIQPVGSTCSTASCSNISMARYFCRICKIFDDERVIYHCPYCNLCRLGKGLGIDYFHCMTCNACMSRLLMKHTCREKLFMDNCPICNEDIFTSTLPVKSLPCGHLMHSTCFEAYTCTNYTCPICGKSLGDMQVYFKMLDAFLAEEKTPNEYSGQTQVILCNDCEKKGTAPFHWLYHKCSSCGSYNTRIL